MEKITLAKPRPLSDRRAVRLHQALRRRAISHPRIEQPELFLPDLDPEHDGIRIGQLTDVHVGRATPVARIRAAIDQLNRAGCDLVVMTGDYLSHHERGVGLLREQLAGIEGPVASVLGNHDHWVDARGAARALDHLGYMPLQNANTRLMVRGRPLTLIGIDDLVTQNADVPRAFRGAGEGSRIVLAHVPRTAELLFDQRASLVLSGHTHGGHVNIPGVTRVLMRRAQEHYLAGTYEIADTLLYVSRGIGGAVVPLRVNAPPEVTVLTLRSAHPDMRRRAA